MKSAARVTCRILVACLALAPLGAARAEIISTERAAAQAELQALGVPASAAAARVQALTDEEAAALARNARSAPAGGLLPQTALPLIILGAAAFWIYWTVRPRR